MKELHEAVTAANGVQLRWNVTGVDASGKVDPANFAVRLFTVDSNSNTGGFDAPLGPAEIERIHRFLTPFVEQLGSQAQSTSGLRVVGADGQGLLDALAGFDKDEVLSAVKTRFSDGITEADVRMLVNRRATLNRFRGLLDDKDYFESELTRLGASGPEALWQDFFEENHWIFGFGLTLVSCESFSSEKLEAVTTGSNIFTGGGKRIDAAMRTRGFIQSLVFAEIKRHDTELLMKSPYRSPDVYQASKELAGAVAQVQKTAHKAVRSLRELHRQSTPGGDFEFEVSTVAPRQVVIAGNLRELAPAGSINGEKMTSFELFRRSQTNVDILTYDELLERACLIVESAELAQH